MNMTQDELALRTELIEACRSMNRLGINKGTAGNISVRHGDGFLISPTGIPYDKLVPEHVVAMNWDASFAGDVLPSSEWRFHRDILQARPDLNAIVHTHSTHATALAVMGREIPAIHYGIAGAGGSTIRCAPYELFGTQALADRAVEALEGRRACLLAHHGMIVCGRDLKQALALAIEFETLCEQYWRVLQIGAPKLIPAEEMARVLERFAGYGQQ